MFIKDSAAKSKIISLLDDLKRGKSITGIIVPGFECFECGDEIEGKIESTGAHDSNCPWNHFIRCPHCRYQSNLAKVTDSECNCRPKQH